MIKGIYIYKKKASAFSYAYSPNDVDRLVPAATVVQLVAASVRPSPLPSPPLSLRWASAGVSSSGVDDLLSGDSHTTAAAVAAATAIAATSGICVHTHAQTLTRHFGPEIEFYNFYFLFFGEGVGGGSGVKGVRFLV